MSISAIQNIQTNIKTSKTSFTSNPEAQTENNNTRKALIIAGLTALGAVGIYIATRGKKGASTIVEGTQKPGGMAIDAFKQAGNKFEKGVAKLANGENYTGKLTQQLNDGKVLIREYRNGVLQTAKKMDGEVVLVGKRYEYDDFGLSKITDVNGGRSIFTVDRCGAEITYITDENTIRVNNGNIYKPVTVRQHVMRNSNCNGGYYKVYCLRNGIHGEKYGLLVERPIGSSIETFYREDGTKWFSLDRYCEESLKVYDNEGKIILDASNPKTGEERHKNYVTHKEYVIKAFNLEQKYLR